jgi:NADH dehydrogenase FAD-containing subunit
LPYDQLIVALGTGINFFNLPGVEASCLTLKTLGDAVAVRNRLITASKKRTLNAPPASASLC